MTEERKAPVPTLCLLAQAYQRSFGLSTITTFIEGSHTLPMPSTLAPNRPNTGSKSRPSQFDFQPYGCGIR
jgi:hypothetical protein